MGRLRRGLDQALAAVIGILLLAIFVLNLYQVGGRYLFGVGEVWIPDMTRFLFVWMVFLGTALMRLRRRHLVIDFVLLRLPSRVRRATFVGIELGMMTLALVLVVTGWRIAQIRMAIPYTGWEEMPTGYAVLALPASAALIGLISVLNLLAWPDGGTDQEGAASRAG